MNYFKEVTKFAHKYAGPSGTPEYAQFVEDLRHVVIAAQLQFRHSQKAGKFTDGVGDLYLTCCMQSTIDPFWCTADQLKEAKEA